MNRRLLALPIVAALLLGACGSDDDETSSTTADTAFDSLDEPDPFADWPSEITTSGCSFDAADIDDKNDNSSLFVPNDAGSPLIDCTSISVKRLDVGDFDDAFHQAAGCPDATGSKLAVDCSYSVIAVADVDAPETAFTDPKPRISFDLSPFDDKTTSDCLRLAALDTAAGCDGENDDVERLHIVWMLYRVLLENDSPVGFKPAGDARFLAAEIATGDVDHFSTIALVAVPAATYNVPLDGRTESTRFAAGSAGDEIRLFAQFTGSGNELLPNDDGDRQLLVTLDEFESFEGTSIENLERFGCGASDVAEAILCMSIIPDLATGFDDGQFAFDNGELAVEIPARVGVHL